MESIQMQQEVKQGVQVPLSFQVQQGLPLVLLLEAHPLLHHLLRVLDQDQVGLVRVEQEDLEVELIDKEMVVEEQVDLEVEVLEEMEVEVLEEMEVEVLEGKED